MELSTSVIRSDSILLMIIAEHHRFELQTTAKIEITLVQLSLTYFFGMDRSLFSGCIEQESSFMMNVDNGLFVSDLPMIVLSVFIVLVITGELVSIRHFSHLSFALKQKVCHGQLAII
jgi:hypothetical protein